MWAGFFPFCKGEKPRCLAGEWMRLSLEGMKIPVHMTRAIIMVTWWRQSNSRRDVQFRRSLTYIKENFMYFTYKRAFRYLHTSAMPVRTKVWRTQTFDTFLCGPKNAFNPIVVAQRSALLCIWKCRHAIRIPVSKSFKRIGGPTGKVWSKSYLLDIS
jgi:hypothetical protein